jgi:type II secretory pathway pseudopilin PulG
MRQQKGFTLLAVMAALALVALASHGVIWVLAQQAQREREAVLLQVGQEFVRAIGSYYESSPGSVKGYPRQLEELVEDNRFLGTRRHLRKLYDDPVVPGGRWEVIRRPDGGIEGVASTSHAAPVRSTALDLGNVRLPAAQRYSDWRFVFVPPPPAEGR